MFELVYNLHVLKRVTGYIMYLFIFLKYVLDNSLMSKTH